MLLLPGLGWRTPGPVPGCNRGGMATPSRGPAGIDQEVPRPSGPSPATCLAVWVPLWAPVGLILVPRAVLLSHAQAQEVIRELHPSHSRHLHLIPSEEKSAFFLHPSVTAGRRTTEEKEEVAVKVVTACLRA